MRTMRAPRPLTLRDPTFRSAWQQVLHRWRPMAGWTVVVWLVSLAVLGALTSAMLAISLRRAPDPVVGNEALLGWLISPRGAVYVLLAGATLLTATVVRFAGLFRIVTDDLTGHTPSVSRTALGLVRELPVLYRVCVATVGAALALTLPLIAALAGIRATLLHAHDINFYLAERPPEWWWALTLAGAAAVTWGIGVAYLAGRTLFALPAVLDGHRPIRAAVRRAWRRSGAGVGRRLRLMAAGISVWLVARLLVDSVGLTAASLVIDAITRASSSLRPIVLAAGAHTAVSLAADAAVSFLGFSLLATLLTTLYHEDADRRAAAPPSRSAPQVRRTVRRWLRPRRLALLGGTLLVASAVVSGVLLERLPAPPRVAITTHRAGLRAAPENTLLALERSIAAGADVAEIDVQRTRDGTVVVVHDADLMRVAGDARRIRDTRYADLRSVQVGRDPDGSPGDLRLPTLDDFLRRARGRIGLNIELKYYGWDAALAPAVVTRIRAHDMEGEVSVMSLELAGIRQVRRLAPELPTGYLATVTLGDLRRLPVQFLAVPRQRASVRFIRTAQAEGLRVLVWTLNDVATMVEFIERGVDGIITDDPGLGVRVRDEVAALSPVGLVLLRFRDLVVSDPE